MAESRERMLEAAVDLLRGFGLSGAGINDVVRDSGAPKGSVYHFFPGGKLQIAAEALALYGDRVDAFIDDALAGRRSNVERVRALFEAFARRAEQSQFLRSCAVGTVSLDLGDARRSRAYAGLLLTAIEGAYVRARAERSATAFREAGSWLARLVE
jgi:TetR/AcrR family transcriptional repressor of lmrAB and yxaGH operons